MSSIGAADAASTIRAVSRVVVARTTLRSGFFISIAIPTTATSGSYPRGDTRVPFLRFVRNVRGGVVNIFVHGEDPEVFRGTVIVAEAIVRRKTYDDDREMTYVDLVPQASSYPVTHKMIIDSVGSPWVRLPKAIVIAAEPLPGVIVFTPPDARLYAANVYVSDAPGNHQTSTKPTAASPAPAAEQIGDRTLHRLIHTDGWSILAEDAEKVTLTREGTNGARKTMVHHRPKGRR